MTKNVASRSQSVALFADLGGLGPSCLVFSPHIVDLEDVGDVTSSWISKPSDPARNTKTPLRFSFERSLGFLSRKRTGERGLNGLLLPSLAFKSSTSFPSKSDLVRLWGGGNSVLESSCVGTHSRVFGLFFSLGDRTRTIISRTGLIRRSLFVFWFSSLVDSLLTSSPSHWSNEEPAHPLERRCLFASFSIELPFFFGCWGHGVIDEISLDSVEFPSLIFRSAFGELGDMLGHSLLSQVTLVSEDIVPQSLTPSSCTRPTLVKVLGDDGAECNRTTASSWREFVGDLFVIITAPSALENSKPLLCCSGSCLISVTGNTFTQASLLMGLLTSTTDKDSSDFFEGKGPISVSRFLSLLSSASNSSSFCSFRQDKARYRFSKWSLSYEYRNVWRQAFKESEIAILCIATVSVNIAGTVKRISVYGTAQAKNVDNTRRNMRTVFL